MWRRPTKAQIRSALWAARARFLVARRLRQQEITEVSVPEAPKLGLNATRGVNVALRLTGATCLQRSVVLQQWYADHGVARDVVIGVTSPRAGFKAHAWIEQPGKTIETGFTEITRLPARLPAPKSS
jgi:hypothetical protein